MAARRIVRSVRAGFTVLELIIVIAIIGILSGILFVSYSGVQENGRDAERQSDMLAVKSQLEIYFNNNGTYPTAPTMTDSDASTIAGGSGILKSLSATALVNPLATSGTTNSFAAISTGNPPTNVYWYQSYDSNGSTVCSATPCAKFKIMYSKESDGTTVTLSSIN